MTSALASRVAGLKLGAIVGVLLLPMLVLSYFMVHSLRQDLASTQRELLGMQLNRLVMPVAIDAASGKLDDANVARLRQEGPAIAAALGIKARISPALAALVTYTGDQRYAVEYLTRLMMDGATASDILLDSQAESYHLGSVVSQQGPALLRDFTQLSTLASRSLRDKDILHNEAAAMLMATGSWKGSLERVTQGIEAAKMASGQAAFYGVIEKTLIEMSSHPEAVARILTKSDEKTMTGRLMSVEELGSEAPHIIDDIRQLWSFSADGFETLLKHRLAAMQFKLYTFLAIAAAACVVGVGGAALMFKSTLKQLDGVKQSRDQADSARRDAELAAQQVQAINDEVVRLNAGLAGNIEMLREAQEDNVRKGRMAQLGQLTATVAHELRNPLGAVRTSAFLLERKIKGKGLGIEPQIERINNGVTRCDNIISQLLDFARTKAIQPESLVFDEWLVKLVEEEAQGLPAEVAIECDLNLGSATQDFDPTRMRRALINLISNASEAMVGKGEGTAKPGIKSPLIVISTRSSARGVEFSVSDNGPGIAPENADKIFEPLFTTKNFGTGLGLPAVQKIMEQHGGGLEVRSSPGQGAMFVGWWPHAIDKKEAA